MTILLIFKTGNKWAKIGKLINNRSDVQIKNRFHSLQRKIKIQEEMDRCLDIDKIDLLNYSTEYDSSYETFTKSSVYQQNSQISNVEDFIFVDDRNDYLSVMNKFRPSALNFSKTSYQDSMNKRMCNSFRSISAYTNDNFYTQGY